MTITTINNDLKVINIQNKPGYQSTFWESPDGYYYTSKKAAYKTTDYDRQHRYTLKELQEMEVQTKWYKKYKKLIIIAIISSIVTYLLIDI